MKKSIVALMLLIVTANFAQEITIQNNSYFVEGKKISSLDVKKLVSSNAQALALFKSFKTKESVGGFLLGLGASLVVVDLVTGISSDVKYPSAFTYVGLTSLATSIPVLIGRKKKRDEAIAVYNKGLKSSAANNSDFECNLIANQRGYGIQFQF
jgi:hypothetical protein